MIPNKLKKGVVAIITLDDMILLGKRIKDGGYFSGEWHIPGETVEDGETDEEALIRGMKEETGLAIKILRCLGQHKSSVREINWYECLANSYITKPGSDLSEVKWIPMKDVYNYSPDKAISLWPIEVQNYFQRKVQE